MEQLGKDVKGAFPSQCNGNLGFAVSVSPQLVGSGFSGIRVFLSDSPSQADRDFASAVVASLRTEGLMVDDPTPKPFLGTPVPGPRLFGVAIGINGPSTEIAIGRKP